MEYRVIIVPAETHQLIVIGWGLSKNVNCIKGKCFVALIVVRGGDA